MMRKTVIIAAAFMVLLCWRSECGADDSCGSCSGEERSDTLPEPDRTLDRSDTAIVPDFDIPYVEVDPGYPEEQNVPASGSEPTYGVDADRFEPRADDETIQGTDYLGSSKEDQPDFIWMPAGYEGELQGGLIKPGEAPSDPEKTDPEKE